MRGPANYDPDMVASDQRRTAQKAAAERDARRKARAADIAAALRDPTSYPDMIEKIAWELAKP